MIAPCPLKTPHIPSIYSNEQTTKETKAINNSYIYIHISCKCDINRAGHFTLDAHASRPVACLEIDCDLAIRHPIEGLVWGYATTFTRMLQTTQSVTRAFMLRCPGSPVELPPAHPGTCPDGWHKFGAFCCLPFPDTLVWWNEAEERCQKEGGGRAHLPTVMLTCSAPLRNEVALTCTTCLSTKSSKTNPPAVSPLGLIDIPRFM